MGEKGNASDAAGAVEQVGQEAVGVAHAVGVGVVTAVATDKAKERLSDDSDDERDGPTTPTT